jgi:hypothetical protein
MEKIMRWKKSTWRRRGDDIHDNVSIGEKMTRSR